MDLPYRILKLIINLPEVAIYISRERVDCPVNCTDKSLEKEKGSDFYFFFSG